MIMKLQEEIKKNKMLIEKYEKDLESSPPGRLMIQKNHGSSQLILSYKGDDGRRIRRGVNQNEKLLRQLAKKEFARKALETLKHNNELMERAIRGHIPFDIDEIMRSMNNAYSQLPEDYFFDRDDLVRSNSLDESDIVRINRNREWGKEPYKESWYHSERKNKRTSRGKYVRSKSEQLIIEALYHYGIPMHYDEEKTINGVFIVPDFTFKDYKNEFFYWDHFGMMEDPGYAKRNISKLDDYYDAGLIPGDNLIITFARGDNINMAMIDAVIVNEIIPRL